MIIIFFIARLLIQAISIYQVILLAYAVMSWLPNARGSELWNIASKLTRPYLDIFDRFIPVIGGISFNVMIAIFVLQLVRNGIFTILRLLA